MGWLLGDGEHGKFRIMVEHGPGPPASFGATGPSLHTLDQASSNFRAERPRRFCCEPGEYRYWPKQQAINSVNSDAEAFQIMNVQDS